MKQLTVKLKQHTPLIHFQHYQEGATLRASEVKPRLDRYILENLGNGNYKDGCDLADKNGWIIGENALNYKMRIVPKDKKNFSLKTETNRKGKKVTEVFPLILSNMGGKDNEMDLVNFSMYESIELTFNCFLDNIYNIIRNNVITFFVNNNFGQRNNKGFGSFSVIQITDEFGKAEKINSFNYIEEGSLYLDFPIGNIDKIDSQKNIFKIIDIFWKNIKQGCKSYFNNKINSMQSYVGGMKVLKLNDDIPRMPSPVLFKPMIYKDENQNRVSVFILKNISLISQLKNDYPTKDEMINKHITIDSHSLDNMTLINDIVNNIVDENGEIYLNHTTIELYEQ